MCVRELQKRFCVVESIPKADCFGSHLWTVQDNARVRHVAALSGSEHIQRLLATTKYFSSPVYSSGRMTAVRSIRARLHDSSTLGARGTTSFV